MFAISSPKFIINSTFTETLLSPTPTPTPKPYNHFPLPHIKIQFWPIPISTNPKRDILVVYSKNPSEEEAEASIEEEDEWLQKLPDEDMPLYSHSLPCIEAWLRSLGLHQSKDEDRSVWFVEKHDWHAQLSLDVTDLNIRYLKRGPGDLGKDMERRFSYALSREDIENAILGGP